MPRMVRLELEGTPLHIVQRGNDRQACFRVDEDRRRYLAALAHASRKCGCAIHAYVLMTNHVHLLITPGSAGGASRMMQSVGRRYVAEFNARHRRTGTLWEGRFKSSLVFGAAYAINCHRYIELNPVRAGMVADPGDYPWSSYRSNALGESDSLLTMHDAYRALGDAATRLAAYRALVAAGLDDTTAAEIRANLQQGRVFGPEPFQTQLERSVGQCTRLRIRGRQPVEPITTTELAQRILRK